MITDYLINNRLYLKEKIRIQCADLIISSDSTGHWNNYHQWVELEDFIELVFPTQKRHVLLNGQETSFIYKKDDKVFIYWCDVRYFLEKNCLTIEEVRNNKLNEILD
jgi:hypothetical protein